MRTIVATAAVCLSGVGLSWANEVSAAIRTPISIPAEDLGAALKALATQRKMQVMYASEDVRNLHVRGLSGNYTPQEALSLLLDGTGLTFRFLDEKTISIFPATLLPSGVPGSGRANEMNSTAPQSEETDQKHNFRDRFRMAQVGPAAASVGGGTIDPGGAMPHSSDLEEIVVTAQKRAERLQDVPVPVTAISADALIENNQPRLQDFYSSVPGLSISPSPGSGGQQMLVIRGITTGAFTNPTVGVTVDDVPYGSSTSFMGNVVPDIDPSDLARVEVLRGPQGTLYGASSMGGLVKFVTVDPSTERISGRVQAGASSISNGSQAGYNLSGAINVPITDNVAVRASAFTRQTPAYLDNPVIGVNGVNRERVSGGLLAALLRLSDTFTLKLNALYQQDKGDSADEVDVVPGLGDLQQNYIRGTGGYERKTQAYSAVVKGSVGHMELTSITGYNINTFSNLSDATYALAGLTQPLYGVPGTPLLTDGTTRKLSEEIRATVAFGERFEWLIGGFYTHESFPYQQAIFAEDPTAGAILARSWNSYNPATYTEYSGFTDLTYHLTDQLDIQLGGRESEIEQTAGPSLNTGPLLGDSTVPEVRSKANAFTYLVTPRFRFSPSLMLYARFASGYRPGGSNVGNPDPAAPSQYEPDKTENYELGLKGDFLDHLLTVDASIYYIDWKRIQIALEDLATLVTYKTNGSEAKSEGVELSIHAQPLSGLTLAASGTYDDAKLTQAFPANSTVSGASGSRLPFTPHFAGALSVDQEWPTFNSAVVFAGATATYVGDRLGTFVPTPSRQYYPGYAKFDLRAGARYMSWLANIYAVNVGDRRGALGGGAGTYPPFAFTYIQPRTIGVSISRTF